MKSVGCTDIMPYKREESKVINQFWEDHVVWNLKIDVFFSLDFLELIILISRIEFLNYDKRN